MLSLPRLHPVMRSHPLPIGGDFRYLRVGLLGGSFNPAHNGHRHISLAALKHFSLHEIWWLVTPQNPLKSSHETAPLHQRQEQAEEIARHPRIRITALEKNFGTQYTAETVQILKRRFPRICFIWLMGADNMQQLPSWYRWQTLVATMPVAILDRGRYCLPALAGKMARRYAFARWHSPSSLAQTQSPAWYFFRSARHSASSTALRATETKV